ncbi:MAG TPA: type I restriction enzyme HsdR N-terminal domain-containing protein [Cyclobacteriaceae bacterium]|nr:type I restriction enzyme HsdR N-terminal domain-containing protein [Cyclobacteriaceae bacterium]HMV08992.1 type I restriction enzyme HsdR N-terminal domain-containing protein [Cyclobacteriaceae bacterium]HMV90127.1 type I restriction enzyme HsdR N-terminal domain-containing protein [Cyclobacteriaceae bacterium]HMX00253.1 type I restriction enzyme HsdR N-terminal domain-containing protein [Cyclobacteriaceae bacterium]HMX49748.1 type I restriction enzyme HsdR N-terminal domain-containing prot
MVKLDLPGFDYQVSKAEGKIWIFDIIRKKRVVLTPEEWVRQHIIHFFINQLNYPKSLIKIESGLTYNRLQKRSDVVVHNREGKPWLLMECKAPDLQLNQNTILQAAVYNQNIRAKYIAVSNGMKHVCYEVRDNVSETELLKSFPEYR